MGANVIYDGRKGATIELLDDILVIRRAGFVSLLNHGLKGEKRIPYSSITSVQFKEPGMTTGYIQFGVAGGKESRGGVGAAVKDENTVLFNSKVKSEFRQLRDFIEHKSVAARRSPAAQAAPAALNLTAELTALADLRDRGVLSDEEFAEQKARLLAR